jgi:hypothetical protein
LYPQLLCEYQGARNAGIGGVEQQPSDRLSELTVKRVFKWHNPKAPHSGVNRGHHLFERAQWQNFRRIESLRKEVAGTLI